MSGYTTDNFIRHSSAGIAHFIDQVQQSIQEDIFTILVI